MRKALIVLPCLLFPALATAQNTPPVADAGPDQTIFLGDSVTLHGTATDADYDPILTWQWEVISAPAGSMYDLAAANTPNPTFMTETLGDYVITLVAWDGLAWSDPDALLVMVVENQPPTAVASARPLSGPAQLTVNFDGTLSSDPEGGDLIYGWDFGDGSFGSDATTAHSYNLPDLYHAILTVVDERGLTDFDVIEITVCGDGINCPPVADAGQDQMAYLGESVQLLGSAADHDGDEIVSWAWSIDSAPEGSSASFDDPGIADPVFTADLLGAYVLSLVVSDGEDPSEPDTLTITVEESPDGWGGASVVGMQPESPSTDLNCLIGLLIPLGVVLLLKRLRRR